MPRNVKDKYEYAYVTISMRADHLGIEQKSISKILMNGINQNRMMMRGELRELDIRLKDFVKLRQSDTKLIAQTSENTNLDANAYAFIPRNFLKSGIQVIPALLNENPVLRRMSLCDKYSNIFFGPVGGLTVTKVIANAHLRISDVDKLLSAAIDLKSPPALAGAKRTDTIWGAVILHLLALQDRNALSSIRTTEALVASVTKANPEINPTTIRHVLAYVVKSLNSKRGKSADSGSLKPARD